MKTAVFTVSILLALSPAFAAEQTTASIDERMNARSAMPAPERIALWAADFIGTPYDTDPLGAYVTRKAVIADDAVDCMYHVFRSVELGLSNTADQAITRALDMRFRTKGRLGTDGSVLNYDERFEYGEDMPASGRWGTDITASLGARLVEIPGSRGIMNVSAVPASGIHQILPALKSGDIVFFIKTPSRRVVGEIVGHMGIIQREGDEVFLIHASGRKNKTGSGKVVKLRLADYAASMPFVGFVVTRF